MLQKAASDISAGSASNEHTPIATVGHTAILHERHFGNFKAEESHASSRRSDFKAEESHASSRRSQRTSKLQQEHRLWRKNKTEAETPVLSMAMMLNVLICGSSCASDADKLCIPTPGFSRPAVDPIPATGEAANVTTPPIDQITARKATAPDYQPRPAT